MPNGTESAVLVIILDALLPQMVPASDEKEIAEFRRVLDGQALPRFKTEIPDFKAFGSDT